MRKLFLATSATVALFVSVAVADEAANKVVGVEGIQPASAVNAAPRHENGAAAGQPRPGFGAEIVFVPSPYTPQGIAGLGAVASCQPGPERVRRGDRVRPERLHATGDRRHPADRYRGGPVAATAKGG